MDYVVEIPKLSSLILKHDLNAPMAGLDTVPDETAAAGARLSSGRSASWWRWALPCWAFRALQPLLSLARQFLQEHVPFIAWSAWLMGPMGFVAVLAGWVTTEVGRQPYTVYGLLLTADSRSPIAAPAVAASLIAFMIVYFFVFGAGIFYILRLMAKAAARPDAGHAEGRSCTAGINPGPAQQEHGHAH